MANIVSRLNDNAEKYRMPLLMLPFIGLREHVLQHMNFRTNTQWKEVIGLLKTGAQLRPHTGNVNVQSGLDTEARELEVRIGDVIVDENPEDLRKSILAKGVLNSREPSKFPLEAEMLALLMNNISEYLAPAIWQGVRNGSGTTTLDLFDGFDKITADLIASNHISTGNGNLRILNTTIDSSNAVDVLREIYKAAPKTMRKTKTKLFVPYEVADAYNENMAEDFQSLQYNKEFEQVYLMGSNRMCEIVPQVGKEGSDLIHLTIAENMNVGTDLNSDQPTILVKEIDNPFKIRFVVKMGAGVQFGSIDKRFLFTAQYQLTT